MIRQSSLAHQPQSLPLGGDERSLNRAGWLALAAMFRAQAAMLFSDGDQGTAQELRCRARGIEARELAAELASGARVIVAVAGHA